MSKRATHTPRENRGTKPKKYTTILQCIILVKFYISVGKQCCQALDQLKVKRVEKIMPKINIKLD